LGGSVNKWRGSFVAAGVMVDDNEVLAHARRKGEGFYRHNRVRKGSSMTSVGYRGHGMGRWLVDDVR
jgi:hypothetical protein